MCRACSWLEFRSCPGRVLQWRGHCSFPWIQSLAESRTAQVRQVWGLGTQTGCYTHCVVLHNWHCWEQPQVVVLSRVLNVVAHPFAQGTVPKHKSAGAQREQKSHFAATLTPLTAQGKESCALLLSIRLSL